MWPVGSSFVQVVTLDAELEPLLLSKAAQVCCCGHCCGGACIRTRLHSMRGGAGRRSWATSRHSPCGLKVNVSMTFAHH